MRASLALVEIGCSEPTCTGSAVWIKRRSSDTPIYACENCRIENPSGPWDRIWESGGKLWKLGATPELELDQRPVLDRIVDQLERIADAMERRGLD